MDGNRPRGHWGKTLIALAIAIPFYIWSWEATQIDLGKLVQDAYKAGPIVGQLLRPSLFARGVQRERFEVTLKVPCSPDETYEPQGDLERLRLSSYCLNPRDPLQVTGVDLRPNTQGRLYWIITGVEGRLRDERFTTDADGSFTVETDVPPLLGENPGEHRLQAELRWEAGSLNPSPALRTTAEKLIETVFLALMATTLANVFAIPLSFLGARNIMPDTGWGRTVYVATRTFFNLTRSIEPLILATIFAIWVGFGPFAGVLALTVSTVANLGKLYSEAAESIDPGPIEAITATGANRIQVIWFAVIPQIVPPYIAFAVYQWDINVRMSTIIGFVGGGGIGMELSRWINQLQWNAAATAVWGIVLVVTVMDYASALIRERLV